MLPPCSAEWNRSVCVRMFKWIISGFLPQVRAAADAFFTSSLRFSLYLLQWVYSIPVDRSLSANPVSTSLT